ncbi:MAG: hypothetical protein ABIL05_03320, partial [candidate division WOR-3 bacterium]
VRETERLVRRTIVQKRSRKTPNQEIEQMAEILRKKFGIKVEIFWGRNRGKIVFHLFTPSELERIFNQLITK